jgi:hypothetical protein
MGVREALPRYQRINVMASSDDGIVTLHGNSARLPDIVLYSGNTDPEKNLTKQTLQNSPFSKSYFCLNDNFGKNNYS